MAARLHSAGVSATRALALWAALGGPAAAQGAPVAPEAMPLTEGLYQVAQQELLGETAAGSDLCHVVAPQGLADRWSPDTPEAASVFLLVRAPNGEMRTGTGTIVAGSDHGKGERVLTAAHVLREGAFEAGDREVWAFSSEGVPLARLRPVEVGATDPITPVLPIEQARRDVAVLEPVFFMEAQPRGWSARAAPLAEDVHPQAILLAQPQGGHVVAHGASGGAVFDGNGAITSVFSFGKWGLHGVLESPSTPFHDALANAQVQDPALQAAIAAQVGKAHTEGVAAFPGGAGIAVPVMGAARAALGAEEGREAPPLPFLGRMAAFPQGECHIGQVEARPRWDMALLAQQAARPLEGDAVAGPGAASPPIAQASGLLSPASGAVEPWTPTKAWRMAQGMGWYPDKGPDRVRWQALRGLDEEGHAVPLAPVRALIVSAAGQEGRVGREATAILAHLDEHARTGLGRDIELPSFASAIPLQQNPGRQAMAGEATRSHTLSTQPRRPAMDDQR